MTPEPGDPFEELGVLNPASGRTPDGRLHLLPRLVAAGNVSRVGLAEVVLEDGVPVGVERRGVVLAPDEGWERGTNNAGVEDPRTTWVPSLGLHVMTYVAFGPLGPRLALAVSADLQEWRRLGPVQFAYQPGPRHRPEPVPQQGRGVLPRAGAGPAGPPGVRDAAPADVGPRLVPRGREGAPAGRHHRRAARHLDLVRPGRRGAGRRPARWSGRATTAASRCPSTPYEELKIGAGPPPIRVHEGWLLIHHGVTGEQPVGFDPTTQRVEYAAGAMLLDPDDPSRVLARTAEPILAPETDDERAGTVPNVVFPTAIEEVDGVRFVFYGMADSKIGVARLDRREDHTMTRTLRNTVGAVVLALVASLLVVGADDARPPWPPRR